MFLAVLIEGLKPMLTLAFFDLAAITGLLGFYSPKNDALALIARIIFFPALIGFFAVPLLPHWRTFRKMLTTHGSLFVIPIPLFVTLGIAIASPPPLKNWLGALVIFVIGPLTAAAYSSAESK